MGYPDDADFRLDLKLKKMVNGKPEYKKIHILSVHFDIGKYNPWSFSYDNDKSEETEEETNSEDEIIESSSDSEHYSNEGDEYDKQMKERYDKFNLDALEPIKEYYINKYGYETARFIIRASA